MEKTKEKYRCIIGIVLSMFALSWLLLKYYSAMRAYGLGHPEGHLFIGMPTLSGYFMSDGRMFFGYGVWSLCILSVVFEFKQSSRNRVGLIAIISTFFLFLFTLKVGNYSLYLLVSHFPGISALRVVERIVVVMLLPIGIIVAGGVQWIEDKSRNASISAKILYSICLCGILSVETMAYKPKSTPIYEWRNRIAALKEMIPVGFTSDAILYIKIKEGDPWYSAELDGMILSQDLGVVTLNGYSGNFPPGYSFAGSCSSPIDRLRSNAYFLDLSQSVMQALSERIITISPTLCNEADGSPMR